MQGRCFRQPTAEPNGSTKPCPVVRPVRDSLTCCRFVSPARKKAGLSVNAECCIRRPTQGSRGAKGNRSSRPPCLASAFPMRRMGGRAVKTELSFICNQPADLQSVHLVLSPLYGTHVRI